MFAGKKQKQANIIHSEGDDENYEAGGGSKGQWKLIWKTYFCQNKQLEYLEKDDYVGTRKPSWQAHDRILRTSISEQMQNLAFGLMWCWIIESS